MNTRLPLSPYCNPLPAHLRQPRCFPLQKPLILSLFCKDDFQEQNYRCMAITHSSTGPLSQHTHSRQATLHTAHDSAHCLAGSYLVRTHSRLPIKGVLNLRRTKFRSPRKPGRMLHAIGARPESLTPSTHPKLGVKSRHQGLHRCALHRIFRPYLEEAVLTRILHRQNV